MNSITIPQEDNMRKFLGNELKILQWLLNDLPKDESSIQNAIIIQECKRNCLLIDPQQQALNFLKNKYKGGVDIIGENDQNLFKTIEICTSLQRVCLIKINSLQIDTQLQSFLHKQVLDSNDPLKQLSTQITSINNNSSQFQLFLLTEQSNPKYEAEVFVKVCVINFAITLQALEEQMLAQIVEIENPSLEKRKINFMQQDANQKLKLFELENKILEQLSAGEDLTSILNDEQLILTLTESQNQANLIKLYVKESAIIEKEIDISREDYRSLAVRATIIFSCVIDLSPLDPMYQFSLQWFKLQFRKVLVQTPFYRTFKERIEGITNTQTSKFYIIIMKSVFERHKLLYSFLMTVKILKIKQNSPELWNFFLKQVYINQNLKIQNPFEEVISHLLWIDIYCSVQQLMTQIPQLFGNLDQKLFVELKEQFISFFLNKQPYDDQLHTLLNLKEGFQKLLLIKAIKPDKINISIQDFISESIGKQFIIGHPLDLKEIVRDSENNSPLLFVLTPGTDSREEFLKVVDDYNMNRKYTLISLGQGQGQRAEQAIKKATRQGFWVILENCHLASSWMNDLDRICNNFDEGMNKDFRLWLSTMSTTTFPLSVLTKSLKMVLETPQGLRLNLANTYNNLSEVELNDCNKTDIYKKAVFALSFFHAIIQDRRRFGAIGWNNYYDFTNEDFSVARKQLKLILQQHDHIEYKEIYFMIGSIHYGGKITDPMDNVLLQQYITDCLCEASLFNKHHEFSFSGNYFNPDPIVHIEYVVFIEQMPLNSEPEAFGLNENASLLLGRNEMEQFMDFLTALNPFLISNTESNVQTYESRCLKLIESIIVQIPPSIDLTIVKQNFRLNYNESMNNVIQQEVQHYNRLLNIIQQSLNNMNLSFKGLLTLSTELEQAVHSLIIGKIPKLWEQFAYLQLKPLGSWLEDFKERMLYIRKWTQEGQPKSFWLPVFFNQQQFFIAQTQNYARKNKLYLEKIVFESHVMDQYDANYVFNKEPEVGCYIYGLFLEGARWNTEIHSLAESHPAELYFQMPSIFLKPVLDSNDKNKQENIYKCPLYRTVLRQGNITSTGQTSNYITSLNFIVQQSPVLFTKMGSALFLSLRY